LKRVILIPLFPARPALPDRWMKLSFYRGGESWIISYTSGISKPLAATSVAIIIFFIPFLKRLRLYYRSFCAISPCKIAIFFLIKISDKFICLSFGLSKYDSSVWWIILLNKFFGYLAFIFIIFIKNSVVLNSLRSFYRWLLDKVYFFSIFSKILFCYFFNPIWNSCRKHDILSFSFILRLD